MEEDIGILERALLNLEATQSQDEKNEFESLYKNWGKLGSQEERRIQLLENQKGNRHNNIDQFRGILELVNAVEDNNKLFKPYNKVYYRPNIYVAGFHKTSRTYHNVLMLSEWMIEKPSDFSQNWYVVPCPTGVRVLVVATKGSTKFYTKYGHFKFERYTGLPGGNPYHCNRKSFCVLDCFYCEATNTLYLLDLLAWNNQPMTDCETEFRQYWMKTQLEELPDTKTINKKNKVIIKILPMMPCTNHFLSYLLSRYPQYEDNVPKLDGLLFYHKQAHYIAGETPLVGWLYPYMIPEVLGDEITMHPEYLREMPDDYINQANFIQKFEKKSLKKNKKVSSNSMEMDMNKDNNKKMTKTKAKVNECVSTDADVEEQWETFGTAEDENEAGVTMDTAVCETSDPVKTVDVENGVSMDAVVGEKIHLVKTGTN